MYCDDIVDSMYAMENNTVENALTSEELHVQFYIAPDCQNGANYIKCLLKEFQNDKVVNRGLQMANLTQINGTVLQ